MAKKLVLPSDHASSLENGLKISKIAVTAQMVLAAVMAGMILFGMGAFFFNVLVLLVSGLGALALTRSMKRDKKTIALLNGDTGPSILTDGFNF